MSETDVPDILVVDDTPANLDLLTTMLVGRQYRFRVASSGKRALAAARASIPDLILLDITMPDMSGYDVCAELRSDPRTGSVPVIFISALESAIDKVRAFQAGGADYVMKPFQFEEVIARIEHQLRITRLQREMAGKNAELAEANSRLMATTLELEQANLRLARLATTDGLTGVANRRRFDEMISTEWARACRDGSELSLMIIDVDHFKLFNDAYGHQQGDECLKSVAGALQAALQRSSDFVARYGGEEFVVLLPSTSRDDARTIGERLREQVERLAMPHRGSPDGNLVTVSIGAVTAVPEDPAGAESFVAAADGELYRAKREGRNRVCCAGARE
jgi:diguanylate cyclase (GGDEF)-like protein